MGRYYKRKGDGDRHEEGLRLAFNAVKSGGLSHRKTAEKYHDPKSTVADYVKRDKETQEGRAAESESESESAGVDSLGGVGVGVDVMA